MKTRKICVLIAAFATLALMATACNKNSSSNNSSSNSAANSSSAKNSDSTSGKTTDSSSSSTSAGSSPTAVAHAFYDAVKNKDVPGMKNTMSKKSLSMLEEMAKKQNQNLDEVLRKGPGEDFPDTFEAKDETINGDEATLKLKGKGDNWSTLHFVKEDGQWKLAFDKGDD